MSTQGSGPKRRDLDWDSLAQYLAGELSPQEAERVRQQLAAAPEDAALVSALDQYLSRPAARNDIPIDVDAALDKVMVRRTEEGVHSIRGSRPARRWFRKKTFIAVELALAAGVIFAIGLATWARRTAESPARMARNWQPLTFEAGIGGLDSIRLGDRSMVVLAPLSRLRVIARPEEPHLRLVELEGQARFDVIHDARRPFVVRAGAATIQDLGTVFTVSTHRDDVRVSVQSGVVLLRNAQAGVDSGIVLAAGSAGWLRSPDDEAVAVVEKIADVAWLEGRVVFDSSGFDEIAANLRRWYGLTLTVSDPSIAGRHYTGTAMSTEPRNRVVERIALALGAELRIVGDTVILQPRKR